jgi:hypothetical protein
MMHAGLHALNWGLQTLGIVLVVIYVALVAVTVFVTVLVASRPLPRLDSRRAHRPQLKPRRHLRSGLGVSPARANVKREPTGRGQRHVGARHSGTAVAQRGRRSPC